MKQGANKVLTNFRDVLALTRELWIRVSGSVHTVGVQSTMICYMLDSRNLSEPKRRSTLDRHPRDRHPDLKKLEHLFPTDLVLRNHSDYSPNPKPKSYNPERLWSRWVNAARGDSEAE